MKALSSRFSTAGCPATEETRLSGERVITRADSFQSTSPSSPLGRTPPNPRDLSHSGQNELRRRLAPPPAIPAAESALGLRPRSALSSAQVFPEWITSTSPCNHLPA